MSACPLGAPDMLITTQDKDGSPYLLSSPAQRHRLSNGMVYVCVSPRFSRYDKGRVPSHPFSSQGRSRNKSCLKKTRTIGKLLLSASQLGHDCSLNNFLFLLPVSTPPSNYLSSLLIVLIPSCPPVSGHKLQQYLHHTDHNIYHCPQPRPSPRSKQLRVSLPVFVIVSLVDQVVAPWSSARTAGRASPAKST